MFLHSNLCFVYKIHSKLQGFFFTAEKMPNTRISCNHKIVFIVLNMIIFFEFPASLAFQKEENYKQLPYSLPYRDYYYFTGKRKLPPHRVQNLMKMDGFVPQRFPKLDCKRRQCLNYSALLKCEQSFQSCYNLYLSNRPHHLFSHHPPPTLP